MGDETNTTVDISFLESPKPPSQQPPQSIEQDGTLEEILAQSSTEAMQTFAASINQSAMKEANKTEEFRQELRRRLFRAIIKMYVWSTTRLTHETDAAEGRLAKDVQGLLREERDQGRSSSPTILGRQALVRSWLLTELDKIVSVRVSQS